MTKRENSHPSLSQSPTSHKNKHSNSSERNNKEDVLFQCPSSSADKNAWKAYWQFQKQSWRTEPEIDLERRQILTQCLEKVPDIAEGIYPFKDTKLSRADIEWLLATHENGRGPVDWSDKDQRSREGLDLRGADLRGIDLSKLPLAKVRGGIEIALWPPAIAQESKGAQVTLDDACIDAAIHLEEANLLEAHLEGARLHLAHLEQAVLFDTCMEGIDFTGAYLEQTELTFAHLERADLSHAHLEQADLSNAHLEGASLQSTHLEGAFLCGAIFDHSTRLNSVYLSSEKFGVASFVDIYWGDVNVAVVKWSNIDKLGDENAVYRRKWVDGVIKSKAQQDEELFAAVRANRQIAMVLQGQGLSEDAARFTYRAQHLARKVLWRQGKSSLGQFLFSLFIDLLAGYGYKPLRSFLAYLLVIASFATVYGLLGSHLTWNEAIVISMTAFHGRGFFSDQFKPGDPQALVAAIEAFVGLIIEVTLIATLTQRFFRK